MTRFILINTSRSFAELGLGEFLRDWPADRLCTLPAIDIALKHVGRPVPNVPLLAGFAAPRLLVLGDMGEVGDQGPAFHAEVGAYARERGVDRLLAHGPQAIHAAMAFGGGGHFDDMGALQDAVRTNLAQCASIAVKGSRFMAMERVVDALTRVSATEQENAHAA